MREAISLYADETGESEASPSEFVGVHKVSVA
jgi:hypothetical protein